MNKFLLGLCCISYAFADPFYGETDDKMKSFTSLETDFPCKISAQNHRLQLTSHFEKLQFIGVVIFENEDKRALFLDNSSHLIELRENDLISQQGIQIEKIDLKSVHYILWHQTNDCENPTRIRLKL